MKILHLITSPYGGAGTSCMRLHHALREEGVSSKVLSLHGKTNAAEGFYTMEDSVDGFSSTLREAKRKRYWNAWKVRFRGKPKELFSFPGSPWKVEEHPLVLEADIIHLHWIAGMVDITRFFDAIKQPVVWTLHDAWPFSGGFHYESYFNPDPFKHISDVNLAVKRNAYARKNITLVSPSRYLAELCKKSNVFDVKSIAIIPYGIPTSIYHPQENRAAVRSELGIKQDQQLWFFASDELDYFRKGADLLRDAFYSWKNENVKLVIAGRAGKFSYSGDSRIHSIGRVHDEKKMVELLNASDALIHTSREDNLPNLIIESLCCGTPVLSTPCGGMPEMIQPGVNGWLTKNGSVEAIQDGFEKIFRHKMDRTKIASGAQAVFAPHVQAKRYVELYNTL